MGMHSRIQRLRGFSSFALIALVTSTDVLAKEPAEYLGDAKEYFLSPLHWDRSNWILAGEAAAATAAAYSVDARVRHSLAPSGPTVHGDPNSLRDSLPMASMVAGTLAVGLFTDDPQLRSTASDMAEAVVLASGGAFALKHVFGRARPDGTMDKSSWRSGGDSFPSGHTAAVFAAAQVLADSRPEGEWSWPVAAYSLGALTAYARMNGNMHWFSDTVAGAALGMASGRFVSNRAEDEHDRKPARLSVQPLKGGAFLSLSVDPYLLFEK